jgi:hypothetical protein
MNSLSLKWGTIKSYDLTGNIPALQIIEKWHNLGVSMSVICHQNTVEQKQLICDLIDAVDCPTIHLDWNGIDVSKEQAKKYIMEYSR